MSIIFIKLHNTLQFLNVFIITHNFQTNIIVLYTYSQFWLLYKCSKSWIIKYLYEELNLLKYSPSLLLFILT